MMRMRRETAGRFCVTLKTPDIAPTSPPAPGVAQFENKGRGLTRLQISRARGARRTSFEGRPKTFNDGHPAERSVGAIRGDVVDTTTVWLPRLCD
jgi:hypothetical protein